MPPRILVALVLALFANAFPACGQTPPLPPVPSPFEDQGPGPLLPPPVPPIPGAPASSYKGKGEAVAPLFQRPKFDAARASGVPPQARATILSLDHALRLAFLRDRPGAAANPDPAGLVAESDRLGFGDFGRVWGDSKVGVPEVAGLYLDLLARLQATETAWRDSESLGKMRSLYQEYVNNGAASGISQIQMDQIAASEMETRGLWRDREREFQDALEAFKVRVGLPLEAPVVPDVAQIGRFRAVYKELDGWVPRDDREPGDLDPILAKYPTIPDLVAGHPAVAEGGETLDRLLKMASTKASDDRERLRIRADIRRFAGLVRSYQDDATRLRLALRRLDAVLDRLLAPPTSANPGQSAESPDLLAPLHEFQEAETRLVNSWCAAQALRLNLASRMGLSTGTTWAEFLGSVRAEEPAPALPPLKKGRFP